MMSRISYGVEELIDEYSYFSPPGFFNTTQYLKTTLG